MARNPTWLPLVGLAAAGLGLAWVLKTLSSEASSKIVKQGQTNFWNTNLAPDLAKFLSNAHVESTLGVERTWRIQPGPTGGDGNALSKAREIQARGSVVTTTSNLLDAGAAPRGMAEVTAAEFFNLVTPPEIAVLPRV